MNYYDYCQLAGKILKMSDEDIDTAIDDGMIDTYFEEKTGKTIEDLQEIGDMLINFTLPVKAGLTEKMYQGFVDVSQNKFLIKQECKSK